MFATKPRSCPVSGPRSAALNVNESYSVDVVRGDRRTGSRSSISNASGGGKSFDKPVDNIGDKTFAGPDKYVEYAWKHRYDVAIPGCSGATQVRPSSTLSRGLASIGPRSYSVAP